MLQSRNLYLRGDDKNKLSCNPSPTIDRSGVCHEVSSHGEGCNSPQIDTFSDVPPHTGGIYLLGSAGEAKDLPLEEHQYLVAEILGKKGDVSLKKDSMGPHLQYSGYQPDKSLEEGSFRWFSHKQRTEYIGGFRVFYDPIAGYMEGLGKDDD